MRVLVTGSEGSLMQATIPYLIAEGHDVIGIDNFSRYGRTDRARGYEFVEGDLTDARLVDEVMRRADAVIQGAATIYGVGGFHRYPATILSNDLTLHANILKAAVQHSVTRVVYISSSMVYERVAETPTAEDAAERFGIPFTDYGLSKLVGERMSRAFQTEFGLEFVIWRPFNIITPRERSEFEIGFSHVFADFIDAICIRRENPLRILGDGQQIRCFTWIEDVASAIGTLSFGDAARNESFNLGNPVPVTMEELARRIFARARAHGAFPPDEELRFTHLPAFDDDVRRRIPSVAKAGQILGWAAAVTLDQALDQCVAEALEPISPPRGAGVPR
jgi:UDP-glucose 4-epimerase